MKKVTIYNARSLFFYQRRREISEKYPTVIQKKNLDPLPHHKDDDEHICFSFSNPKPDLDLMLSDLV